LRSVTPSTVDALGEIKDDTGGLKGAARSRSRERSERVLGRRGSSPGVQFSRLSGPYRTNVAESADMSLSDRDRAGAFQSENTAIAIGHVFNGVTARQFCY
jgi:hypothetical protein